MILEKIFKTILRDKSDKKVPAAEEKEENDAKLVQIDEHKSILGAFNRLHLSYQELLNKASSDYDEILIYEQFTSDLSDLFEKMLKHLELKDKQIAVFRNVISDHCLDISGKSQNFTDQLQEIFGKSGKIDSDGKKIIEADEESKNHELDLKIVDIESKIGGKGSKEVDKGSKFVTKGLKNVAKDSKISILESKDAAKEFKNSAKDLKSPAEKSKEVTKESKEATEESEKVKILKTGDVSFVLKGISKSDLINQEHKHFSEEAMKNHEQFIDKLGSSAENEGSLNEHLDTVERQIKQNVKKFELSEPIMMSTLQKKLDNLITFD